jgi:hypothetical protein
LRSCLLPQDWAINPLILVDLGDIGLRRISSFFTYLSTNLDAKDKRTGEAVHITSACQLMGFKHVLGPLWTAEDKLCTEVATLFYKNIRHQDMTDSGICQRFHGAVRELRDCISVPKLKSEMSGGDQPHWAAFVYFGT